MVPYNWHERDEVIIHHETPNSHLRQSDRAHHAHHVLVRTRFALGRPSIILVLLLPVYDRECARAHSYKGRSREEDSELRRYRGTQGIRRALS
jgi:hypothetical protein